MVAYFLTELRLDGWGSSENMQRAERLLAQARASSRESPMVLNNARLLAADGGSLCGGDRDRRTSHPDRSEPDADLHRRLQRACRVQDAGRTCRGGLALQAQADQLNPRSPWKFNRYRHMGFAALMLGRDQDAIAFLQRSLALHPENPAHRWTYRKLAAAYARTGQTDEARRSLSAADRLWPYFTVRGVSPEELSSPVYVQQIRNYQAALRLAGARDHADEDADFGVPADGSLHSEIAGRTPTEAPGARTIRTAELVALLANVRPLVIDTGSNSWGRSIPGAVGLRFSGLGGSFADEAQDRLRRKMVELTGGDLQPACCRSRLELRAL